VGSCRRVGAVYFHQTHGRLADRVPSFRTAVRWSFQQGRGRLAHIALQVANLDAIAVKLEANGMQLLELNM